MATNPTPQAPASVSARRQKLERLFRGINRWSDYAASVGMLAIVCTVLIQVVSRWIDRPVAWTEEATRFIFIWIVFLGIGQGFRKAESARVTIFLAKMPRPIRKLGPLIYTVATIGFFVLVFVTSIDVVRQQLRGNEMGSALMIPMWIIGISIPLSSLIGILGVCESLLLHRDLLNVGEE